MATDTPPMRSSPSYFREQIDGPHATPADEAADQAVAHAGPGGAHHGMAHTVSPGILLGVFSTLMVLTGLTVYATHFDFGYNYNLIIALGLAVIKAMLVIAYFMHLRYDSPMYTVLVGLCLVFIAVFISFTIIDTGQYAPILTPVNVTPS